MRTDEDGRTRTMAPRASVTSMHYSVCSKVTHGHVCIDASTRLYRWVVSVWMQALICIDTIPLLCICPSRPTWILGELHKGSSNILFSLLSSPWPGKATVCIQHFLVWAVIGESLFYSYLSFLCKIFFSCFGLVKIISRLL